MTEHRCPSCDAATQYAAFSGGREFYCPGCGNRGYYPEDQTYVRANLLRTPDGAEQLRAEMREEIRRRNADADSTRRSEPQTAEPGPVVGRDAKGGSGGSR